MIPYLFILSTTIIGHSLCHRCWIYSNRPRGGKPRFWGVHSLANSNLLFTTCQARNTLFLLIFIIFILTLWSHYYYHLNFTDGHWGREVKQLAQGWSFSELHSQLETGLLHIEPQCRERSWATSLILMGCSGLGTGAPAAWAQGHRSLSSRLPVPRVTLQMHRCTPASQASFTSVHQHTWPHRCHALSSVALLS